MKLSQSLALLGATAALAAKQYPLQFLDDLAQIAEDAFSTHFHKLQQAYGDLTEEAQTAWEDVAKMFPEDMARVKSSLLSKPKKHTRRPDHKWDHIVRGKDIVVAESEETAKDKLHTYDLRVKKVDPSALQVDPGVKQYSGYLDDNEEDKHLFYCEYIHVGSDKC